MQVNLARVGTCKPEIEENRNYFLFFVDSIIHGHTLSERGILTTFVSRCH